MSDAEYVARDGDACPYCRASGELEGCGSLDMANGSEVTVDIVCGACGAAFTDVYRLAGYESDAPLGHALRFR